MLEPKVIISLFKQKSTELLHYQKHKDLKKEPKTESKMGGKKKKKNIFLPQASTASERLSRLVSKQEQVI